MAAPGCLFRVSYRHWLLFFLFFFSLLPFLTFSSSSSSSSLSLFYLLLLTLSSSFLFFSFQSESPWASQVPRIINNNTSNPRSRTGSSLVPLFLLIPDWTRNRFQQIQHIGCAFLCFFLYSLLYIPSLFLSLSFFVFTRERSLQSSDIPVSRLPACRSNCRSDCLRHPFSIELTNNLPGMFWLIYYLLCYIRHRVC